MITPDGHFAVMAPAGTDMSAQQAAGSGGGTDRAGSALERQVLVAVKEGGADPGVIAQRFDIDLGEAVDILNRLLRDGKILREG